MERRHFPLVKVPPLRGHFQGMGVYHAVLVSGYTHLSPEYMRAQRVTMDRKLYEAENNGHWACFTR
jgi:hypothetical protein